MSFSLEKYMALRDRVSQLEDTVQMVYDRLVGLEAATAPRLTPAKYMCPTCNVERTYRDDKGFMRCPKCGWPSP